VYYSVLVDITSSPLRLRGLVKTSQAPQWCMRR